MANNDLQNDLKIDINWNLFGTGPEIVNSFNNGELDMCYMGLPPAIIAISKGTPIKCVAGGHVEGTIMIAKKKYKKLVQLNNNIYDVLAQFKGKVIGVPSQGSIHDVILSYYLKKNNLQEDIKVKNYGQPEFIALDMKNGILDGGVGTPALAVFASTILDSHLIIQPEMLCTNNPSYGVFFHDKIIKNHPKLVLKFLSHHKKASYMIRDSPLKAAEIIAMKFSLTNKNYIKSIFEISPKYCIALSEGYINSTIDFIKILHKLGYIKRELKIEDIFYFKFVEKLHPEKEHYSI